MICIIYTDGPWWWYSTIVKEIIKILINQTIHEFGSTKFL